MNVKRKIVRKMYEELEKAKSDLWNGSNFSPIGLIFSKNVQETEGVVGFQTGNCLRYFMSCPALKPTIIIDAVFVGKVNDVDFENITPPSKDPNRKEALRVTAKYKNKRFVLLHNYVRDQNGRPKFMGDPVFFDSDRITSPHDLMEEAARHRKQ